MALHLLYQFICTNDNASSYNNGDVIDVYYNDSDDSIDVNVNSSPVTSGGGILNTELSYPTFYYYLNDQHYQFCDSSTLVFFTRKQTFPYADKKTQLNSPSCPVAGGGDPPVCDISFAYISSSNSVEGMSNGSITAALTSSNGPVKIAIGDFNPATGGNTMTASGNDHSYIFTDLNPGTYTLYAYDSNNCKAVSKKIVIETDFANNYGTLYDFTFDDREGNSATLQIQQRGYSGSTTNIQSAGQIPVIHKLSGMDQTIESPVLPSHIEISLYNITDKVYMNSFRESDERRFRALFYMDYGSGNELQFQGYLTQELLSEPFEKVPYVSRLIFTDRLSDLKNFKFNIESGNVSLLEIFRHCLSNLGISNGFRIFDNLYEITHDQTASDDPWTQTFLDVKSFYTDNEPDDCLTVVEKILLPRRAHIFSWGGYWYIMRISERSASIDYREFNGAGTYVTNGTINPIIDIKRATESSRITFLSQSSPTIRLEEVFKYINIRENRKLRESIAKEFTEENINASESGFTGWNGFIGGESGSWLVEKIGATISFRAFGSGSVTGSRGDRRRTGSGVSVEGSRSKGSFSALGPRDPRNTRILSTGSLQDQYMFVSNFEEGQAANPGYSLTGASNSFDGAFISNIGSLEYNKNDKIELSFEYFFQMNNTVWIPYVVMRWYLKVGTKWLNFDGTWSDSAVLNDHFIEEYNTSGQFSIIADFDPSFTDLQNDSYEFRAYNVDSLYTDVVAQSDTTLAAYIRTLPTTSLTRGARLSAKMITVADSTKYYIYLYELRESSATESGSLVIEPNDASNYRWEQVYVSNEITEGSPPNYCQSVIRYGTVVIKTYPNSEEFELVKETKISTGPIYNQKDLNYELSIFDADTNINNYENLSINFFKLSNGSACTHWGPSTLLNDNKIQNQLAKELSQQYSISKYRVTGSARTDIPVAFFNVFRHVSDNNRIYIPVGMAINYRHNEITGIDMIESASDDSITTGEHTSNEHTNAFT